MNKIQKYFLIGWIPCVIYMLVNVWYFFTPGKIGYKEHLIDIEQESVGVYFTEFMYGWDNIVIFLAFSIIFTLFIYYELKDRQQNIASKRKIK